MKNANHFVSVLLSYCDYYDYKLKYYCNFPKNQPIRLCFRFFAIITTYTYLYSCNCSLHKSDARESFRANFFKAIDFT